MIRTEIDSMPSELDDVRRRIMQLEIEEMALKEEDNEAPRPFKLTKELAEEKDRFNAMKFRWESDKQSGRGQKIKRRDRADERRHGARR